MKKKFWMILVAVSTTPTILLAGEVHLVENKITVINFLLQPKFIAMFIFALVCLILLKTGKMNNWLKVTILSFAVLLFGIAGNIPMKAFESFAMHPSPMCAATKPLLYGLGIPFMAMLVTILILTVIGPKLFCSYICPVGASQELIALLSEKLSLKIIKTPYRLFNTLRIIVFLAFLIFSTTAILNIVYEGNVYPKSLYDSINPFHGFEFQISQTVWATFLHYLPLFVTLGLSFKFYRPFCYGVCPIGLYTQIIEFLGINRITLNKSTCTSCNLCVTDTCCPAINEIMKESVTRPDCFACGRCIEKCPADSLSYGFRNTKS